jgi:hypothetical protein
MINRIYGVFFERFGYDLEIGLLSSFRQNGLFVPLRQP